MTGHAEMHEKDNNSQSGTAKDADDVEQQAPSPATGSEKEKPLDPDEVDWDGPADPKNPRNWPRWRRAMLVGIITCVVFST